MLTITPIPCLGDNFAFLLVDGESGEAAVVDTPEAAPIVEEVERRGLRLSVLLCTHHHFDHVGGNVELAARYGPLRVAGFEGDRGRIPAQNELLADGDIFILGESRGRVLHVPGHTRGHLAYYFQDDGVLFTGDTLFAAGCGRLFEGTPEVMQSSLQRLRDLPEETRVYFAHEYTEANLAFAARVEPESEAIRARRQQVRELLMEDLPTCPSTIAEERQTNPFLRWDAPAVIAAARDREPGCGTSPSAVFGVIRRWKDRF